MCLPLWLDEKRSHRQKSQPKWWTQGYRWEHRRRRNQTRWLSIMYGKSFCTGHANCSTKFFHLAISNLNHFVSLILLKVHKVSESKMFEWIFLHTSQLIRMKLDVVVKQFKLHRIVSIKSENCVSRREQFLLYRLHSEKLPLARI